MFALLRRAIFRWWVKPKRVIGDTISGPAENIRELEESGIRAYVSHVGPEGELLRRDKTKWARRVRLLLSEEHLANLEPSELPATLWAINDARWDLCSRRIASGFPVTNLARAYPAPICSTVGK